ncbi:MAG TPA: hypothetical protein VFB14_25645 [Bryobacteraceae bacterium]|nr:hypothetical protein [Bryobacteraceae bacterium]
MYIIERNPPIDHWFVRSGIRGSTQETISINSQDGHRIGLRAVLERYCVPHVIEDGPMNRVLKHV